MISPIIIFNTMNEFSLLLRNMEQLSNFICVEEFFKIIPFELILKLHLILCVHSSIDIINVNVFCQLVLSVPSVNTLLLVSMREDFIITPKAIIVSPLYKKVSVDDIMHVEEFKLRRFSVKFPIEASVSNDYAFEIDESLILHFLIHVVLMNSKCKGWNVNA